MFRYKNKVKIIEYDFCLYEKKQKCLTRVMGGSNFAEKSVCDMVNIIL